MRRFLLILVAAVVTAAFAVAPATAIPDSSRPSPLEGHFEFNLDSTDVTWLYTCDGSIYTYVSGDGYADGHGVPVQSEDIKIARLGQVVATSHLEGPITGTAHIDPSLSSLILQVNGPKNVIVVPYDALDTHPGGIKTWFEGAPLSATGLFAGVQQASITIDRYEGLVLGCGEHVSTGVPAHITVDLDYGTA